MLYLVSGKQNTMKQISLLHALIFSVTFLFSQNKDVSGEFSIEKNNYLLGEPIYVQFIIKNSGDSVFIFEEGGDYRGLLIHERYRFRVFHDDGHELTNKEPGLCFGGLGNNIELKKGEKFRAYIALNPYANLLYPGNYTVLCERNMTRDIYSEDLSNENDIIIRDTLHFLVEPYNKAKLVSLIKEYMKNEYTGHDEEYKCFFTGKPLMWAVSDLAYKLKINAEYGNSDSLYYSQIIKQLPDELDPACYLSFRFGPNLMPITGTHEPQYLYVFIRNNYFKALETGLLKSRLKIDKEYSDKWLSMVKNELYKQLPEDKIEIDKEIVFKFSLPELIDKKGAHDIQLEIHGFRFDCKAEL